MVTVRYINQSAVNITWTPVFEIDDYSVEGYIVHYSSVSLSTMRVKGRCSGSAFFNQSRESTSYGIISDLSEEYDGFEFTILIETSNGTLGDVRNVTPVIGLRNNITITNGTTNTPTDSECYHLAYRCTHEHTL